MLLSLFQNEYEYVFHFNEQKIALVRLQITKVKRQDLDILEKDLGKNQDG